MASDVAGELVKNARVARQVFGSATDVGTVRGILDSMLNFLERLLDGVKKVVPGWRAEVKMLEDLRDELQKMFEEVSGAEREGRDTAATRATGDEARASVIEDSQGNPIDDKGKLIVDKIESIDELSDDDFTAPKRSVELPNLPSNVDAAIGANSKPVIIKRNIFSRNAIAHSDLTPSQSRDILRSALYNATLYGQNRKMVRPYNWVVINTTDENGDNRLVLLEVSNTKDNVEVVHWHYIDNKALETLKRQAKREGGQLLILPSDNSEEAGGLSSRTLESSSAGKGTTNSATDQIKLEENLKTTDNGEKRRSLSRFDGEYRAAVESGDMERAQRMVADGAEGVVRDVW